MITPLLRSFGPLTIIGGGSPPATPVLSVVDQRDGTGATATISGADVGATETVYVAALAGTPGNLGFASVGSRSGDGDVDLALADGAYIAYCLSTLAGLVSAPSNEVGFRVTGGAVTATSVLALSKAKLREALSVSPTFQAARGVATAADALQAIHMAARYAKDEREFASLRPFAVVGTEAELDYVQDSGGTKNYLAASGAVYLYLTANDEAPDDPAEGSLIFDNFCGGVMDDLEAIAGLDDRLAIRQASLEGYGHSDPDNRRSQPPFWYALIRVEWGV